MQTGLNSADRKLLIGTGAIALILIGISLAFLPPAERDQSFVPSSYSSGEHGARAAYILLEQLHFQLSRWEQPPSGLLAMERPALLILAGPSIPPSSQERRWLRQFVEAGNRILFCGASLWSYFPEAKLSLPHEADHLGDASPIFPSYISRDAAKIKLHHPVDWEGHLPVHIALYGKPDAAVIAVWPIGRGELIWWASADPLTNAGLQQADNLQLFLNSVSGPDRAARPAVYWDEYFHGQRGSLWSYVYRTPLRWAALQLLLLLLAVLFSLGRSFATTWKPLSTSRLSPLEFIQTMGGLYERTKATSVPISVAYRNLRLRLSRRLSLDSDVPDSMLAQAACNRLRWDEQELISALKRAEKAAKEERIPARKALDIVKHLDGFVKKMERIKN